MLIRRTRIGFSDELVDVRIEGARISEIAASLGRWPGEQVLEARGGALLTGLRDHHMHLAALAAALRSVPCGPPRVRNPQELGTALQQAAAEVAPDEWLRGTGYHESVAGEIDRSWLDRHVPQTPVRVQHRSGRLWILNSAALARLGPLADDAPLERAHGKATGRIFDADHWLRARLGAKRPGLAAASRLLASRGVTCLTEVTPRNRQEDLDWIASAQERGELLQDALVMGDGSLDDAREQPRAHRGATKIHLHENELPPLESLQARIERSHAAQRPVALHCAALGELAVALEALAAAGCGPDDRIEHASVAPEPLVERMGELGVRVVTQPNFVYERGDRYLSELPREHWPWLYRGRAFRDAGIALAAGSDAPFGDPDPWLAMQAAVDRRTRAGTTLGEREALSPEEALGLFSGDAAHPGEGASAPHPGALADLCLLDRPWSEARRQLSAVQVVATLRSGAAIWPSTPARTHEDPA